MSSEIAKNHIIGHQLFKSDSVVSHNASQISITDSGGYFDGTNVEDALMEVGRQSETFNGSFNESFDFRVSSDGVTITGSLEQSGGGDLVMHFSDGFTTLDCTPAATISLTAGTDTNPQVNYVYVLQSTKVLTVSTSSFPNTEHIKVARVLVQSATGVQTNDALRNQNWNDHIKGTNDMGHVLHIAERLRQEPSKWFSGVDASVTIVGASSPDDVYIDTTAGIVYQMHQDICRAPA